MRKNKHQVFNAYGKCITCGAYISYKKKTCENCKRKDNKISDDFWFGFGIGWLMYSLMLVIIVWTGVMIIK